MRSSLLLAAALASLAAAKPADAFGLRTHLYIAEQVYAELQNLDCKVRVGNRVVDVPRETVCEHVLAHKGHFLAGAIGPDAFPDLIVGQSFVHPGTPHGRQAADWLDLLLSEARTSEEIAFAYGNMMHAAGDIFAHSYVNNYAGGVFEITKFRSKDIERRHTQLEKYIDQRLAYEPEPKNGVNQLDGLKVPADLLIRTMVKTNYMPVTESFDWNDLKELFDNPYAKLGGIVGSKLAAGSPGGHMMTMWALLAISQHHQSKAVCDEVNAVREVRNTLIAFIEAEYHARMEELVKRGQPAPPRPLLQLVSRATCVPPPAESLRGYPDEQRAATPATLLLKEAEQDFAHLLAEGHIETDDLTANRRKTWWKAVSSSRRRNLLNRMMAYEAAVEERDRARALRIFTDYWADDVHRAVAKYMEASLLTAKAMVRSSAPYPPAPHEREPGAMHYSRWFTCYRPVFGGDPIASGEAICDRMKSLQTEMSLATAARYAGINEATRNLLYRYLSFQQWVDKAMTDALFGLGRLFAPSLTELVGSLTEPKRIGRDDLDRTFSIGRNGQLTFRCVSDWIDADLGMLAPFQSDQEFRPDENCRKVLEKGAELDGRPINVEIDQPRLSPTLVPDKFIPLKHAITLGKLALLDGNGVRQVAGPLGASMKLSDQRDRYSIIIDTARSLDGSYQWNGISMPYPKQNGISASTKMHRAGYPLEKHEVVFNVGFGYKRTQRFGFPYYQSQALRRTVFRELFPEPFEGEILKSRRFNGDYYPFRPCEDDPFRSEKRGGGGSQLVCETTGD